MQIGDLGNLGLNDVGTWDNTKLYKINNIVQHKGGVFNCINNTTPNEEPGISNKWTVWIEPIVSIPLSDSTNLDSSTTPASSKAVKKTYDTVRDMAYTTPTVNTGVNILERVLANQFTPGKLYSIFASEPGMPPVDVPTIGYYFKIMRDKTANDLHTIRVWHDYTGEEWTNYRDQNLEGSWRGWRRVDNGGAFPGTSIINFAFPANGGRLTMPSSGYLNLNGSLNAGSIAEMVNINNNLMVRSGSGIAGEYARLILPVAAGHTVEIHHGGISNNSIYLVKSLRGY